MLYAITDKCTGCHACQTVCPSHAIYKTEDPEEPLFQIHSKRCTGCEGSFDDPQCASICPIEEAIINQAGIAVNPRGSLTGIQTHN